MGGIEKHHRARANAWSFNPKVAKFLDEVVAERQPVQAHQMLARLSRVDESFRIFSEELIQGSFKLLFRDVPHWQQSAVTHLTDKHGSGVFADPFHHLFIKESPQVNVAIRVIELPFIHESNSSINSALPSLVA